MTKKLPLRNHRGHNLDTLSQNLSKLSPTVVIIDNGKARCQYEATCPHHPIDGEALARGAYQAMSLVAPYMSGDSRAWFQELSKAYLTA